MPPAMYGVITPVRNQVVITEPAPPIWRGGFYTDHGFIYGMQRPDGRIVLGGCRNVSPTKEINNDSDSVGSMVPQVSAALRAFLRKFPKLKDVKVESEWLGVMGFTIDGRPLIGELGRQNEFINAGFSGVSSESTHCVC